jgi:hypothetical protein
VGSIKYAWPVSAFYCSPALRKPLTEAREEGPDSVVPARGCPPQGLRERRTVELALRDGPQVARRIRVSPYA